MAQQKMVMKLTMGDAKKRAKALQAAVSVHGVLSAALEDDKIVVVGDGVDSVELTMVLRKKMGYVDLLSVADEKKDEKKEEKKADDKGAETWPNYASSMFPYPYVIMEYPYY